MRVIFKNIFTVKVLRFTFVLILIICPISSSLFSQKVVKPTRQSSLEAFAKDNFEQAYTEFKELLVTYPKDPLYKYYSGVCLIKLNRNPLEAELLLNEAIQRSAVVKSLPSDALFYLGRSQQLSGKFTEAIGSYNLFIEQVGKKASKEYNIAEFLKQCSEKKGKITEPIISAEQKDVVVQSIPRDVVKVAENKPAQKRDTVAIKPVPAAFDKILDEAMELQSKADSLNGLATEQKKQLNSLPTPEKNSLKVTIAENETAANSYQKAADVKYDEAQFSINKTSGTLKNTSKEDTTRKQSTVAVGALKTIPAAGIKNAEPVKQPDTAKRVPVVINKPVGVFSYFEVLPNPVTDKEEKIRINPDVPPGLIYRIQIAVFRNAVAPSYFKGITPVYGFKVAGTDKTNYFAGMFRRSADAKKALSAVKTKGFKDAFIVALSGNKPVSADRAIVLEQEWGKKPFMNRIDPAVTTPSDTLPPTLSFRVEVIKVQKAVKEDVVEGMRKIAGNRGMDIQTLDDDKIVYLIGNFITFESAAEYADLLIRNGYREAKVGAWLGKKEIPVETAKQLFDDLR